MSKKKFGASFCTNRHFGAGKEPAVVRIVGQLGGYGPVVNSELEGTTFEK
jgi:hypothetical protein